MENFDHESKIYEVNCKKPIVSNIIEPYTHINILVFHTYMHMCNVSQRKRNILFLPLFQLPMSPDDNHWQGKV